MDAILRETVCQWDLVCPSWRGPAIVVELRSMKVVHVNDSFCRLSASLPACIVNGTLRLRRSDDAIRLRHEILAMQAAGKRHVAVTCRTESGPGLVTIHAWLPESPVHAGAMQQHIAVLEFSGLHYRPEPAAMAALSDALLLTPCERRDLASLASGKSLRQIAMATGVAVSTARSRVKCLLSKSGCRGLQDLLGLVRSHCRPVPEPETESEPAEERLSGLHHCRLARVAPAPKVSAAGSCAALWQ